jgi:large subunit ribosomal protein L14
MLQVGSRLNVSDNSGAKKVECIKILNKHSKSFAYLGDFVIVSVKQLRLKGNVKVKKKDICLAFIFKTKALKKRIDGRFFKFYNNTVILLNKNFKPYGTRFFGPVAKDLRKQKKLKISLLRSSSYI